MKTLIVYYSLTGCTRTAAQKLAPLLGADLEELRESADRRGAGGFFRAGRDAMLARASDLRPTAFRPSDYDLVVVATPVWAFTMCPAVRTWLQREAAGLRAAAFVCTQGGSGAGRAMRHMAALAGREPVARLVLRDKDIRAGLCDAALAGFAADCRPPERKSV